MIAALPLRRGVGARPEPRARGPLRVLAGPRTGARRARPIAAHTGTHTLRGGAVRARRGHGGARPRTDWELRSFAMSAGAISAVFALALLYLGQITSVSAGGYEGQRLAAQRDELRRQIELVDVQLARLDSPARIEAQAARLGLIHLAQVPILVPDPLQAKNK